MTRIVGTLLTLMAIFLIAVPLGCNPPSPTPVDSPEPPGTPETPDAPEAPETPEVPVETPDTSEGIPDVPIVVPPIPDTPIGPNTDIPADEIPRFAVTVASVTVEDPAAAAKLATQEAIAQLGQLGCEAKGIIFFEFFPKTVEVPDPEDPDKTTTKELPDTDKEKLVLPAVREAAGDIPMIGCRARSLVTDGTKLVDTVAVMAIGGSEVNVAITKTPLADDRQQTGDAIGGALSSVKDLAIIFTLSEMRLSFDTKEGVSVEDFIRGALDTVGSDVTLFGGNCFPNDIAEKDMGGVQFYGDEMLEGHVVAMGIGGPVGVHSNHTNEFELSAETVTVTKADDKAILELDGRPAPDVYREIRGMAAEDEFTSDWQHPIGVIVDEAADKVYLRMVLNEDAERKALEFVAPIPEGTKIKILKGGDDASAILASAKEGITESIAAATGEIPVVALLSNCCARGMRLREFREGEECEIQGAILQGMGEMPFPIFGFYAWGELGPIAGEFDGLRCMYQQHTFVSTFSRCNPGSSEHSNSAA